MKSRERFPHQPGNEFERPVADVVAVSVVHFFEIVQIDIQEAELVLFPVLVHILIEEAAIV